MPNDWRGIVRKIGALSQQEIALWIQIQSRNHHLRSPFFSYAFSACVAAANPRARVCLLYQGTELKGFFPFQFSHSVARYLGAGERIGGSLSDFSGLLLDSQHSISTVDLLRCAGLHHFIVSHLEARQIEHGLVTEQKHDGYRIRFDEGAEKYWSTVRDKHKDKYKNLLNRERKLERDYPDLRFVFHEPEQVPALKLLLAEKRAQYARTKVGDALSETWMRNCLHILARQNDDACMPVMTSLYLNGDWAACHFGLRSADVLHYWFPVYNPAYANLSPGLVLLRKVINEGDRHGIKEVDLGEGDAPYKLWLGTDRYENLSADWSSSDLRSFAFRAFRSLSWRAQSMCNPK